MIFYLRYILLFITIFLLSCSTNTPTNKKTDKQLLSKFLRDSKIIPSDSYELTNYKKRNSKRRNIYHSRNNIDIRKLRREAKKDRFLWGGRKNIKDYELLSLYAMDNEGSRELSIKATEQAIDLVRKERPLNNKFLISELQSLAILYYEDKNYDKALKTNNEVVKLRSSQSNKKLSDKSFNTVLYGHIYKDLGVFTKAEKYYKQSLKVAKVKGKPSAISTALNNLGALNADMGKYQEALSYLKKSREVLPSYATDINIEKVRRRANSK